MTDDQRADWTFQEERLILLLSRRHNLPSHSDQRAGLTFEISAVENLVRSYRMVDCLIAVLPSPGT